MKTPRRAKAREVALAALLECRTKEAFVQEVLDRQFQTSTLGLADRRLTTQLVFGVLRRRATLDCILRRLVTRPMHSVQPWLWEALRLGAFQIALLPHVPAHAAIFETVELAAGQGEPKAKGFLNGVLRSMLRLLTSDCQEQPGAESLPLPEGGYRRLAAPVFADPGEKPVDYLADAFSLPAWLLERWLERFGMEECLRLGFWFARQAPTYLRANPLRCNRAELLGTLLQAEVEAEAGAHPQSIKLLEHALIRELPGYTEGAFVVQDESAMWAASALDPQPGWRVLDLCAGPGGKTTHLAELMGNQGRIVACDVNDERLRPLRETCARMGLTIVETHVVQGDQAPPGPYDAALVDSPCSNTGVLGRRPEARWRVRPADLEHLIGVQLGLLTRAGNLVRPGGRLVYSTCSIEPGENRGVVNRFLADHPDIRLCAERLHVPGQPADGGYLAVLARSGP